MWRWVVVCLASLVLVDGTFLKLFDSPQKTSTISQIPKSASSDWLSENIENQQQLAQKHMQQMQQLHLAMEREMKQQQEHQKLQLQLQHQLQQQIQTQLQQEVSCVDYPKLTLARMDKAFEQGRSSQQLYYNVLPTSQPTAISLSPLFHVMSRRSDRATWKREDIIKEHAKLVQDINSLRQAVLVAPLYDDHRDYDESIFNEIIETASPTSTTTLSSNHRTTTARPVRTTKGIPVLVLGGESQRHVVKSQPFKAQTPKPVINLVGTSVSPAVKHPYPYVVQSPALPRKPTKLCLPMMYPTTRRPSLLERLFKSLG